MVCFGLSIVGVQMTTLLPRGSISTQHRRTPRSWWHATLHSGKKHQASEGVCGAKPHVFFYFFYFIPVKLYYSP